MMNERGSRRLNVFLTLSDHNEAGKVDACKGRIHTMEAQIVMDHKNLRFLFTEGLPFHK